MTLLVAPKKDMGAGFEQVPRLLPSDFLSLSLHGVLRTKMNTHVNWAKQPTSQLFPSNPKRSVNPKKLTHTIVIKFDPKGATPLEVINSLDKMLQTNLEEGKISDYSIGELLTDNIDVIILVAKEKETTQ